MSEEALIALYVALTGASEGLARSVIICLDLSPDEEGEQPHE